MTPCKGNVSANRMQSEASLLAWAMLRWSLTSRSNVSANRMQNLKTCFQKLCWGVAWLRKAMSVQTECRTWKLVFKSYAEVPPDFAKQRYNIVTPKYKFLNYLISHLDIVEPKKNSLKILYLEAFQSVFQVCTKMKSGYTILSHANYQNVRITHFLPRTTAISHTSLCYRIAFVPAFCVWVMKYKQHKRMFHFEVAHSLVLLGVKLVC